MGIVYYLMAISISILIGLIVRIIFMFPRPAGEKLVIQRLEELSGTVKEAKVKPGTKSTLTQLAGPARILIKQHPISDLLPLLLDSKTSSRFRSQLITANLDHRISLEEFFGIKLFLAILMPLGVFTFVTGNGIFTLVVLIGMGFAGYILPNSFLTGVVEERQNHIKRYFADAVDLLIVGIEAGLGLDRALRLYCERFGGPLSEEFKKMLASIDVGLTRRQALRDLADRNQLEDLNIFVASILQAERLGTPLAEVLAIQAETARTLHRQWVKEMSAKAPVKILFPLAGLILPALFAVLIGPVVIKMIAEGG